MKVECIDDSNQGEEVDTLGNRLGDRVQYGDIYTLRGKYDWRGHPMYLLTGMNRNCALYGEGWGTHRFKPLNRPKKKQAERERELDLV